MLPVWSESAPQVSRQLPRPDRPKRIAIRTLATRWTPIDLREWPKDHWRRALVGTKVRPRKFYATKHTFNSVALSKGLNHRFITEYCGTSVAMIERHYGCFLASRVDDQLAMLSAPSVTPEIRPRMAKAATFGGGLRFVPKNPCGIKRPRRDLNPCRRRERPVPWAELDDGDARR